MYNARFNKKGNIKTGLIWTWSKLAGNREINGVKGSCGNYCGACQDGGCYVFKSYRYPSVINGHARNTTAFRNDINGSFEELCAQIDRAKNKPEIIRINQSGEIETPFELLKWCLMAKKYPDIRFYLYTKNFDALSMVINSFDNGATVPENITMLISVWHEYGLNEFNEFKKHSFIKAFAYDDGFNYAAAGLNIDAYCTAYDQNGKMNHAVTCEKCKKCFNRIHKVIGCYDH